MAQHLPKVGTDAVPLAGRRHSRLRLGRLCPRAAVVVRFCWPSEAPNATRRLPKPHFLALFHAADLEARRGPWRGLERSSRAALGGL